MPNGFASGETVTLGQLVERTGAAGGELLKPCASPRNRLDQAEIEDFIEGFNQPTYRGMRPSFSTGPMPT